MPSPMLSPHIRTLTAQLSSDALSPMVRRRFLTVPCAARSLSIASMRQARVTKPISFLSSYPFPLSASARSRTVKRPCATFSTTSSKAGKSVREQVSEAEWQTRVDLAACYRILAMYGWDDLVFTHISARVPGPEHHFLINGYGLLFEEITASSLVKVDLSGNIVMDSPHFINPAGFTIHSAIHAARDDATCVLHTHSKAGVAVSAQADGLLPISQIAIVAIVGLGYHDYEGIVLRDDEKPRLLASLGTGDRLILRNHGLLATGSTIPDAFLNMYILEIACQTQIMAQAGGGPLTMVGQKIGDEIMAQAQAVTKGQGGALVWPGLLRKLDRLDQMPGQVSFRE